MTVGTFLARRTGRAPAWAGALLGALLIAGCGGGGSDSDFVPQRLIVLGDEASLLLPADGGNPAGRKYSVNALDPLDTSTPDPLDRIDEEPLGNVLSCTRNRLWVQIVADDYGIGFDACNPRAGVNPQRGSIHAQLQARVADIPVQVAAAAAGGALTSRDLVTVQVGQRDILDIYAAATSLAQCNHETGGNGGVLAQMAYDRGRTLKSSIDVVANGGNGARVVFATIPNVGDTPFGRSEGSVGFNRPECLNELTEAFNVGLRSTGLQNGRFIGLVAFGEEVEAFFGVDGRGGYDNITAARCDPMVPLPDCSTDTLAAGVVATDDYFWADSLRFGSQAQELLGIRAVQLLDRVPF